MLLMHHDDDHNWTRKVVHNQSFDCIARVMKRNWVLTTAKQILVHSPLASLRSVCVLCVVFKRQRFVLLPTELAQVRAVEHTRSCLPVLV